MITYCRPRKPRTSVLMVGNIDRQATSHQQVWDLMAPLGAVGLDYPHDPRKNVCFVRFDNEDDAEAAKEQLAGTELAGRELKVGWADIKNPPAQVPEQTPVLLAAPDLGVPGLELHPDFVTPEEEQALLQAVEGAAWQTLARRRVAHFGHVFSYETRGVATTAGTPPIPEAAAPIVQRLVALVLPCDSANDGGGSSQGIGAGSNIAAAESGPGSGAGSGPGPRRVEAGPGCWAPDQLTVNEYAPGVGLAPHIDTHSAFDGAIVSLSLAGGTVMEFRRGEERRALWLPPRSLLVMGGESRFAWAHYIPHRKSDAVAGADVPRPQRRISFTFRKVRPQGTQCTCSWPEHCDSRGGSAVPPPTRAALAAAAAAAASGAATALGGREVGSEVGAGTPAAAAAAAANSTAANGTAAAAAAAATGGEDASPSGALVELGAALEAAHVVDVYDAIAGHFSATRFAVWPKVREFLESLAPGSLLADVGCGNGKYFGVRRDVFVLGSDRSPGLAGVAARRLAPPPPGMAAAATPPLRADVAVADGLRLPYRTGSLDAAICIAVLHHISTVPRRVAMLRELLRVLRPGGRALVTVWALEQEDGGKLAKWHPISGGGQDTSTESAATAAAATAAAGEAGKTDSAAAADRDAGASENGPGSDGAGAGSTDYFVPWHVPLHRSEAHVAVRAVSKAAAVAASGGSGGAPPASTTTAADGGAPIAGAASGGAAAAADGAGGERQDAASGPAGAGAHSWGAVDRRKGAVVLQRYYHLFPRGELEGLVAQLGAGAAVADVFYDKSNWCVVIERRA